MDTKPLYVVAIGGNALIEPDGPPTVANQFAVTTRSMGPIADLLERGERIVLTHGNGPQVGFMALRSALARDHLHEVPLDSLVADTQGSMGYMIERALRETLGRRGVDRPVATIVTEVAADPDDEAFGHPTKPIGPFYEEEQARKIEAERGWEFVFVAGRGWRRVVPGPAPRRIVQIETIRLLVDNDVTVICCGGGGVPVVHHEDGRIEGLEGVIDKDRVSALLADRLGAARLFVTTAVDAVYSHFGTDQQRKYSELTVAQARALAEEGHFPPGSMGPKVEASCRFVENTGGEAVICHTHDLAKAFDGQAGTRIYNPES